MPARTLPAARALLLLACSAGGDGAADSATASSDAAATQAAAADKEFMRSMTDHHEGLILMAGEARQRAQDSAAKADAQRLHDDQTRERDEMLATIARTWNEQHSPSVMPQHRAMHDSLQATPPAQYDRAFYEKVVAHHREGVAMVDRFMPRLTNADVRAMAERMREKQTTEITEFERKMAAR